MKIYLILGAILAILGLFSGGLYFAYNSGKDAERARTAAQIEEYRTNQALLSERLAEERANERIITKVKIKTIREVVDDCADTRINPAILEQLRN